jgi:hypothetical protein
MATWAICERCGKPFSVDTKYCPSCVREGYAAAMRGAADGDHYPLDMQYCTMWPNVGGCGGDIYNACTRHGKYSCSGEEREYCPCRACCAQLHREYAELNERKAAANQRQVRKIIEIEGALYADTP